MRVIYSDGGMKDSGIEDKNYCTIRAIAIAFKLPYKVAYEIGDYAGREHGKGYYMERIMKCVLHFTGYKFKPYNVGKGITIRRFLEKNTIGKFIVTRRSHAFAIIHGEIHDSTLNTERQIIQTAYEIIQ